MNFYAIVYFLKSHLDDINDLRQKYDPMVTVIKPHLTIVFPIPENDITEKILINQIQEKINIVSSFSIQFSGLERSWDNNLFLTTKTGTDDIRKLHDSLYTGILEPFLRRDIPFSPHITLGSFQEDPKQYVLAEEDAKQKNFSFEERVDGISLIKGDGKLPPQTIREFFLN